MAFTIETNIAEVMADLEHFKRKQIPFASALTLNNLAFDARDDARKRLDDYFTIRTTWVARGIQVSQKAAKRDWPHQSAAVGSRDEFMVLQAIGGIKRSRTGGNMAVPDRAREILGGAKGTLGRRTWPSRVIGRKRKGNRNKFFVNKIKSGPSAGLDAVMRREDNGRYPLQVMYVMKPQVKIDGDWRFVQDTEHFVRTKYATYFGKAFSKAIATAR